LSPQSLEKDFMLDFARDPAYRKARATAYRAHLIPEPAPFESASMRLRLAEEDCPLYRTRVT